MSHVSYCRYRDRDYTGLDELDRRVDRVTFTKSGR